MNMTAQQLRGGPANMAPKQVDVAADTSPLIRQCLRIAFRWRYVIIAAVVGCFLCGIIGTLLMTPQYTASTTIAIAREASNVTDIQGVERETSAADQEFYQTQYGLLQSRSLSERVANRLRLVDDPAFYARFGYASEHPAYRQVNGRYLAQGRTARVRAAGEILLANVTIKPTRFSRLVTIAFTSRDAGFSARVANAWADNFIQSNLERKVQATSYGRDLLQRQLALQKERLDESQRQLVNYASAEQIINLPAQSNNGSTSSERSLVAENLATLNAALSQATAERIQAQARFQQAGGAGASAEALQNSTISSLRQRRAELAADYQRLMVQFEPGYPAAQAIKSQIDQLDRSITREETRVSGSLQADFRQAQERERALTGKVNELKQSYLDLRRRSIQYNIYQQEVDTNRALYDGLLQRFKEIGVAGGVGVNNTSVVDTADVPQSPSSPRLLINLLISLLAGLGLGALLAFALEQMDEAIADPAEFERLFGVALLGTVPKVEDSTPKQALLDPRSDLFDAYLAVKTSLAFTTEHGVPRSLMVTSTQPGEGKSTTSLALAATLMRAQRKVILVDGDMRSPSVHLLGGVSHERGLSNFLAGEDDIASLTFSMEDLGITAMSAGPIPPNAAELLAGNRLSLLIDRLLREYDHVVIDSPPVMGLADAPLIASRVEGAVWVTEAQGARSALVKTALRRLAGVNARIFGGVLTKFDARKAHYGYGYGYNYGYDYGRNEKKA
jgi:capsular exopolysaccharide synthesis family protein